MGRIKSRGGYLRYAKPKITNIHSKNWQVNVYLDLLNEKSFGNVIECHMHKQMAPKSGNYHQTTDQKEKKMVHAYKSVNDLFSALRRNKLYYV